MTDRERQYRGSLAKALEKVATAQRCLIEAEVEVANASAARGDSFPDAAMAMALVRCEEARAEVARSLGLVKVL